MDHHDRPIKAARLDSPRPPRLVCDRGCGRPARVCAWEEPEHFEHFRNGDCGDRLAGVLLCRPCLAIDERDGPWQGVDDL